MMRTFKTFWVVAISVLIFISCDDDNNANFVPQAVQDAFSKQFSPNGQVDWDMKAAGYTADFLSGGQKTTAWFEQNGGWMMTEINMLYDELPEVVKTTFEQSKYVTWRQGDVEGDVEKIMRPNLEILYVIEVESGETEVDLYYAETGVLIKELIDIDNDNDDRFESLLPEQMPTNIQDFIKKEYPNATIAEIDTEGTGVIEVDILDGRVSREIWFDRQYAWLQTSWDIRQADLPQPVKDVIQKESGYTFDDAEYIDTPTTDYYKIELDGTRDKTIKVKEDGTLLL